MPTDYKIALRHIRCFLTAISLIGGLAILSINPSVTPIQAQTCEPSLSLSPTSGTVETGDTFSVEIIVDTCGTDVDGVDSVLEYDSTYLSVTSITAGTLFSSYPFETDEGDVIRLSGLDDTSSAPYSGTDGVLGTIVFSALTEGTTAVTFDFTLASVLDSNIIETGTGDDILAEVYDGEYTINASSTNDDDDDDDNDDDDDTDNLPETGVFEILSTTSGIAFIFIAIFIFPFVSVWNFLSGIPTHLRQKSFEAQFFDNNNS